MLTKKQRDLLIFIHKRMQKDGIPPSFEEMKVALDLRSKSGIHRLITALDERGFLRRLPHKARAIEILRLPEGVDPGPAARNPATGNVAPISSRVEHPRSPADGHIETAAIEIPVMGRIAAGVPIEAIQHASHSVAVPQGMLRGGDHYALEVQGDSMIDIGINHGDIVVVKETAAADDGEIVVALVEDQEATLKRLRRSNGMIALEAANPAYETRIFREDQVKVQGKLVGLIRSY